jgi:hypothetical protein
MKFLSILAIILGFSQCGTLKLEENPPFKITSAIHTNFHGGQPGVSGMNVKIIYTSDNDVLFDSIYFSKRVVKLEERKRNNIKMIIGHFNTSTRNRDLVLDADPKKEINNKTPDFKEFPFELEDNEAIISYLLNGKKKYFKIKSIKKGKAAFFPSAPKQQ